MKNLTRDEVIEIEMKLAEEFFGTSDESGIPITAESVKKLDKITPEWLETEFNEDGDPICWSVMFPTQKELALKFINKEISERELLDLTKPQNTYDALYGCSVITIPEYRRKGIALKVVDRAIKKMPMTSDYILFSWPISEEGKKMVETLSRKLDKKIMIRE